MRITTLSLPHWIWWGKGWETYLSFKRHKGDFSSLVLNHLQNKKETLLFHSEGKVEQPFLEAQENRKLRNTAEFMESPPTQNTQVFQVIPETSYLWHQNLSRRHCNSILRHIIIITAITDKVEWIPAEKCMDNVDFLGQRTVLGNTWPQKPLECCEHWCSVRNILNSNISLSKMLIFSFYKVWLF